MKLDENDYLIYHLYTASKTPRIKKARLKDWILTTVTFTGLSFLFFRTNNNLAGYSFLIAAVLSLLLHPFYIRWRYKQHYRKVIRDTYKNRFGEECTLVINENIIGTKDKTSESTIHTTEIEEINEIKDFYFIKIKTGVSLIISKAKTDPAELESIKNGLKNLVDKKGIKHNMELDWKW